MISELWKKCFLSPYFFTIALRRRSNTDIVSEPHFCAEYVLPSTCKKWAADPMLVDYEGRSYLFYESVLKDKGRIEVAEVLPDCTLGPASVILEDDSHYSYPFVFQHDGQWYMIPESSARNEVSLYIADCFPLKWRKKQVLIRGAYVDTTVFESNGTVILLTFSVCPGCEQVIPSAYELTWGNSEVHLTSLDWPEFDNLKSRGAGPVFSRENTLFRPAQKNKDQEYGDTVLFYRINDLQTCYSESAVAELTPENVQLSGMYFNGLHTYSRSEKYEAIDIRCREFDFWKIPRMLFHRLCSLIH